MAKARTSSSTPPFALRGGGFSPLGVSSSPPVEPASLPPLLLAVVPSSSECQLEAAVLAPLLFPRDPLFPPLDPPPPWDSNSLSPSLEAPEETGEGDSLAAGGVAEVWWEEKEEA